MENVSFPPPTSTAPTSVGNHCPLNDGFSVLDQIMAAISREGDAGGLDAALDFRLVLSRPENAADVLHEFFLLRAALEDRHYLALYRLRRWLEAQYVALVRLDRTSAPQTVAVRLDITTDYEELCSFCAHAVTGEARPTPWTRVKFCARADAGAALVS